MNTQNNWLPPTYSKPKTGSSYFRFEEGDNRFRILSQPILGWVDWQENSDGSRKPVRTHEQPEKSFNPKKPAKHFWAFVVLDKKDGQVKIMEITQSSIQDGIMSYQADESWGDPREYDLCINRKGKELDTSYTIKAYPKAPLTEEQQNAYQEANINLEALFSGDDPFKSKEVYKEKPTPQDPQDVMPFDAPPANVEQVAQDFNGQVIE